MRRERTFASFFMGGFECSTHRLRNGRRLDLVAATRHDRLIESDYRQLASHGIRTVREGLRWHLIETRPGAYDFASLAPMVKAARRHGVEIIWDLFHFGWPEDLDIWSPAFIDRFARLASAAARFLKDEGVGRLLVCPVNENSFFSYAGGQVGHMNPFGKRRGTRLKVQMVRAAIAAIEAVREVDGRARVIHAEPLIHVAPGSSSPAAQDAAARFRHAQWQAWDMLTGAEQPELGGRPDYLDIAGLNFYPHNQWVHRRGAIPLGRHDYQPLSELLAEAHARYGRPLLIAETGAEGGARAAWLHYVADEVREALAAGIPVEGVCLYPVLDYPGWENGRPCAVGLLEGEVEGETPQGGRIVHAGLADEIRRQTALIEGAAPAARHLRLAAEGRSAGTRSRGRS